MSSPSKMQLLDLPNEILDVIVGYRAHPDDLESLALTCKRLHSVCLRWIPEHNRLSKRFRSFVYNFIETGLRPVFYPRSRFPLRPPYRVLSAIDMLGVIANEPDIAFHIVEADLYDDSGELGPLPDELELEVNENRGNAVKWLLSSSPHFDGVHKWEDYHEQLMEETKGMGCYSHYAAAFLLSLLPNVERLRVPKFWCSGHPEPDRLIKMVTCKARKPGNQSSLSQLTRLDLRDGRRSFDHSADFDYIGSSECLFRLPRLRHLFSTYQRAWDSRQLEGLSLGNLPLDSPIEGLQLEGPRMKDSELGVFLSSCPNLKQLNYDHESPGRQLDMPIGWDICSTIKEIQRRVGSQLENLRLFHEQVFAIPLEGLRHDRELKKDPLIPGKVSFLGFPNLKTIHMPLELVANNLQASPNQPIASVIHHLIPPTVQVLGFSSFGYERDATALETVYQFLATQHRILQYFVLISNVHGGNRHESRLAKVCEDLQSMGMEVKRMTIEPALDWL